MTDIFKNFKFGYEDHLAIEETEAQYIKQKGKRVSREKMYEKFNMAVKLRAIKG